MNASPQYVTATEAEQIEHALDALLTAAIAADRSSPIRPERGMVSAGSLIKDTIERLTTWTKAQCAAEDLLSRPVAAACRTAIRTLGERLFEIGGNHLMSEVCDRVSALDPANESRRIGIMDRRWNGIWNWYS